MTIDREEAMPLPALERETLEDKAYRALRSAILSGDVADGQRLVQDALAERLGVSRIPVRQALKRLAIEGLVTVNERGAHFARRFTVEDAREVYGLRALLEPYACRLAVARATPDQVDELDATMRAGLAAARRHDAETYVELNRELHMRLYALAGSRRLLRHIELLWSGTPQLTPLLFDDQLQRSAREHAGLLAAIRKGDGEAAAERLRAHIEHAGDALVSALRRGAQA